MTETRRRSADRRLALIDIGSNSIRLVVFDGRRRAPEVLFNEKVLCGLGRRIQTTGQLDPEGLDLAGPVRLEELGLNLGPPEGPEMRPHRGPAHQRRQY